MALLGSVEISRDFGSGSCANSPRSPFYRGVSDAGCGRYRTGIRFYAKRRAAVMPS